MDDIVYCMIICKNCNELCENFVRNYCSSCYHKLRKTKDLDLKYPKIDIRELSPIQNEIMIGSLLGDAHIENRTKNTAIYNVSRKTADLKYLIWHFGIFKNLCNINYEIKSKSTKDNRTLKTYYTSYFKTQSHNIFYEYHCKWYLNKKKIVPLDIKLSPLMLAVWFCDDGCIQINKKANSIAINIATNGFTFKEVEFLVDLLQKRYKEYFYIATHNKKDPMIYGSKYASILLLKDIYSNFPHGMERKIIDCPEYIPDKIHSHTFKYINYKYLILNIINNKEMSNNDIFIEFKKVFDKTDINDDLCKMIKSNLIIPIGIDRYRTYKISDDGYLFLNKYKHHNLLII